METLDLGGLARRVVVLGPEPEVESGPVVVWDDRPRRKKGSRGHRALQSDPTRGVKVELGAHPAIPGRDVHLR